MKNKIAIVHFQPVEGYPPVMNVIDSMVISGFETQTISTHRQGGDWFVNSNSEILRIGNTYGSVICRYLCYLQFAIKGFWQLLKFKPKAILLYESYSVLPVFLYSTIFPKIPLFIHYHEFESSKEIGALSGYIKLLYFFELKLLNRAVWLSQTNLDRLHQFKELHPRLCGNTLKVFPNWPSRKWAEGGLWRRILKNDVLRFIYVGSLGINTTYIQMFIDWIKCQNGRATLTIVTQNIELEVTKLLQNIRWIEIINNLPYDNLPKIISSHDVGVVLYKGHTLNYIYNVPNKVNEYLACGLNVWYSDVLISTHKFAEVNPQYPLFCVDFSKGKELTAPEFSSEPFEFKHWHEDAVQPLIASITETMDSSLNTF